MAAVLKVEYQGELHRVLLSENEITYEAVWDAVQKLYTKEAIIMKYVDDDSDMCTLCQASFADFVSLASESNGKKVLKLVLVAQTLHQGESADSKGTAQKWIEGLPETTEEQGVSTPNMLECMMGMLKMGMGVFKHAAKQAFRASEHDNLMWDLKVLKFFMLQLHKNNALDENSAAALVIHALPKLLSLSVHKSQQIDRKFKNKFSNLKSSLEALRAAVASTPGLEQCLRSIDDLLANEGNSASEAFMCLLTTLDVLPSDKQADFLKALYSSQKNLLLQMLTKMESRKPWMPTLPLLHEGIVCDGCNQQPLRGLRFKCKTHPDFDLCAECFTKRNLIHSGDCSAYEFDIVPAWGKGAGKGLGKCWKGGCGKGWGKGMMKGNFKGKGKGDCKGASKIINEIPEACHQRPCAREGCSFAATWHPTHCCEGCRNSKHHHGKRCEGVVLASVAEVIPETSSHIQTYANIDPAVNKTECSGKNEECDSIVDAEPDMSLCQGEVLPDLLQSHGESAETVMDDLAADDSEEQWEVYP